MEAGVPEVERGTLRMEAGALSLKTGVPEAEHGTLKMKVAILDLEAGVHRALKMGHWIHGVLEMMVPGVAGDPELSPLVRTYGPM